MKGKYLNLTSFRRDGTGVSTPVWFVQENGRLFVRTDGDSYKVKRIAHNPSVTIAECSASVGFEASRSPHAPRSTGMARRNTWTS